MTVKNGPQEPYPVWHFKNIKERGVWGEVVRASAPLGEPLALYPGRGSKRGRVVCCGMYTAPKALPCFIWECEILLHMPYPCLPWMGAVGICGEGN